MTVSYNCDKKLNTKNKCSKLYKGMYQQKEIKIPIHKNNYLKFKSWIDLKRCYHEYDDRVINMLLRYGEFTICTRQSCRYIEEEYRQMV